MQQGAYDYLAKPFDLDEALLLAERALTARRLTQEVASLAHRPPGGLGVRRARRPAPDHAGGLQDHRARGGQRRERAPARASRARARRWWRARSTTTAAARGGRSWASRRRPSPSPCSSPSCSATRRARSPTPRSAGSASSSWPTAAPCSSTRSATCRAELQVKLLRALQERAFERVGRPRADPHGRARARRHPPRPRGHDEGGAVPRGPLLPAQRGHALAARPARAARRHPAARRALPRQVRRVARRAGRRPGGHGSAGRPRLAGQRARAGERDPARHGHGGLGR